MDKVLKKARNKRAGISGIISKLRNDVHDTFIDMMEAGTLIAPGRPEKQFAIAAIVINPVDANKFLIVKRPSNAKSLPDVWGLPAITVRSGERPEAAVARLAEEKLDTQVKLIGCLGIDSRDKGEHELTLMDVVVKLVGKEPSVSKALTKQTKYVQQQWTDDLSMLQEAASKGSVCSKILLQSQGVSY